MPCENEFTVNITVLHIAHIWTTGPVVRHYHVLTLQAHHAHDVILILSRVNVAIASTSCS